MTDLHVANELPANPLDAAGTEHDGGSDESSAYLDPATLKPDQQTAFGLLTEICAATGQDVHPRVTAVQGVYMHVELAGADARTTWGRMGQSLDALQMLTNMILSRRVGSDVRLMLDADNYRERRAEILRGIAQDFAREVKERNQEAEMDPLPAHERRIIHSALVDDPDISTYSEGDEPHRRIVIAPRVRVEN